MRQGRQKGAWEAAGREAWSCLHEDIKPLREERARHTGRPGALHKEPEREREREGWTRVPRLDQGSFKVQWASEPRSLFLPLGAATVKHSQLPWTLAT